MATLRADRIATVFRARGTIEVDIDEIETLVDSIGEYTSGPNASRDPAVLALRDQLANTWHDMIAIERT